MLLQILFLTLPILLLLSIPILKQYDLGIKVHRSVSIWDNFVLSLLISPYQEKSQKTSDFKNNFQSNLSFSYLIKGEYYV